MKQINFILTLLLFMVVNTIAQQQKILYFDQQPPGSVAALFAPGLLTTEALEHSSPAFSPDGKTVLWAVMKMPSYQIVLMEINFRNGQWSGAHVPSFGDTTASEVYPAFSPDGTVLYFSSDRIVNAAGPRKNRLWSVRKTDAGWSAPVLFDSVQAAHSIYAHSVSNSWERYFSLGPQGSPDWNIFVTGAGGQLKPLPPLINSPAYEDGPFIAPDGSFLIFESDRAGSIGNSIDLYISFRTRTGDWSIPVNMGETVNTRWSERFGKLSVDGKYLFFGRNTGNGFDIYWMSSKLIEALKQQAHNDGVLK